MLDLEPIKQRLAEAKRQRRYEEADRHEAKSRAWSDFYQHAPTDIEELDHLPVGTVVKDKEGDCYARVDNGWIWTEQIFNSLDSFYGPYTVIRTPSQCETPATCEDH